MKEDSVCPKCGSNEVIPQVRIIDSSTTGQTDLKVEIQADPNARIFKEPHQDELAAWICGDCGYTELYVMNPKYLLSAHKKRD